MEASGLVGGIAQAVNAHGSETAGNTDTSLQGTPEVAQVKTGQPKDAEQIAAKQPETTPQENAPNGQEEQPKESIWSKGWNGFKSEAKNIVGWDDKKSKYENVKGMISKAGKALAANAANAGSEIKPVDTSLQAASDKECKDVKETGLKAMDCYRNIGSYLFKYKPEIVAEHNGEYGINDDTHVGILAQEVEENIPGVVKEDENLGYKTVDARHLTMANTAAIGEMVRKIDKIYEALGIKEDE